MQRAEIGSRHIGTAVKGDAAGFHLRIDGFEITRRNDAVGIHNDQKIAVRMGRTGIAGRRRTAVGLADITDIQPVGILPHHPVRGEFRRGTVLDHDRLKVAPRLVRQRFEEPRAPPAAGYIPV